MAAKRAFYGLPGKEKWQKVQAVTCIPSDRLCWYEEEPVTMRFAIRIFREKRYGKKIRL